MAPSAQASQGSLDIPAADLRDLQESILRAVVSQTPLQGCTEVMYFPDMNSVLEAPELVLSDANLAGPVDPGVPVRVLNDGELCSLAGERDHVPYLQFTEPALDGEQSTLVLEVRIAFKDVDPLPLGVISVTLQHTPDRGWQFTNAVANPY